MVRKSMKAQRAHRRKLRFSSTKDVASQVSVKVEQPPQRPIKRRKCQQRVNSVPDGKARPVNSLPAAILSGIQERFTAAKSLGEITLTVLQLFKEHEDLQRSASGTVFPILVPTSDVYKMKGRVCIFHELVDNFCPDCPGSLRSAEKKEDLRRVARIGVITRTRYNESRNAKEGFFRYYGKATVVQHLEGMKTTATQVVANFRQSHRSMRSGIVEEDRALVKMFEDQAAVEKWPRLVMITVIFLGLMFQQDHGGVGLSTISDRLFEARKSIAVGPIPTREASSSDVQRRIYDVVSVLGSCNMIDTSLVNSPNSVDKCLRKHVRFNYDIFMNPRLLFATPASAVNGDDTTSSEPLFDEMVIRLRGLKSPQSGSPDHQLISPLLAYWKNLHAATGLMTSPTFSPVVAPVSDTTSWVLRTNEEMRRPAVTCQPSSLMTPSDVVGYPPQSPRAHKFFSPFGLASTAKSEWYDESLKHLGLYDALPAEDKIDWELNNLFKDNTREMWGYQVPTMAVFTVNAPGHQVLSDKASAKVPDLECHELLGDNMAENSTDFFC
ncbi:hypothetical protein P3T76_000606 [Phytophthora citrophthora]|uniref:Uncharacterized protein n=1 Tax=Phytophthora citrophthora TaxID=4793 RepID=A0AAD9H2D6_9STRA|nr:hypothetical protein P3T76_000606 [Phytophthora citrophthora]